jgi:hypothetical protein
MYGVPSTLLNSDTDAKGQTDMLVQRRDHDHMVQCRSGPTGKSLGRRTSTKSGRIHPVQRLRPQDLSHQEMKATLSTIASFLRLSINACFFHNVVKDPHLGEEALVAKARSGSAEQRASQYIPDRDIHHQLALRCNRPRTWLSMPSRRNGHIVELRELGKT